jgi:DNA-binding NarL/FixJ family response regulator
MNGHFSPRQAEIVSLIAGGLEDKEIARELGVSVATVRTHLQRLYRNIGVHNRSLATIRWLENEGTHIQL